MQGKDHIKVKIYNTLRKLFMLQPFESILIKLIQNKNIFSSFFEKLAPNPYQYKAKTFRHTYVNGLNLRLDISDYMSHYIYFGFLNKSHNALFNLVKEGDIILDIGANIGYTALSMSKRSLPNGTVYAFEPDPYNFEQLTQNINLNPDLPVKIYNIGLGSKQEKLKLAINSNGNLSGNRIKSDVSENFNWVDIDTIDSILERHKISNINLIKIDVEGFELNVLKGADDCIKVYRPILFVEIDNSILLQQGSTARDIILFLEKYYSQIKHAESGEAINSNMDFTNRHFDIIAAN